MTYKFLAETVSYIDTIPFKIFMNPVIVKKFKLSNLSVDKELRRGAAL